MVGLSFSFVQCTAMLWWCTTSSSFPMSHVQKNKFFAKMSDRPPTENKSPLRRFPFSKMYYENYLKRLNSQNQTEPSLPLPPSVPSRQFLHRQRNMIENRNRNRNLPRGGLRIIIQPGGLGVESGEDDDDDLDLDDFGFGDNRNEKGESEEEEDDSYEAFRRRGNQKSENFQVLTKFPTRFKDVGGYQNIKQEL